MFELANRLVGIYKTHDTTKSVTINPHCFDTAVAGKPSSPSQQHQETESDEISASPVAKKGRSTKVQDIGGEENGISGGSGKVSREKKMVLGDSTNRVL